MPTEQRISVRIPNRYHGLKKRLARAARTTGVIESELVIAAILGAVEFIEHCGEVVLPIHVSARTIEQTIAKLEGCGEKMREEKRMRK